MIAMLDKILLAARDWLLLLGRLLLALIFVHEAITLLSGFDAASRSMSKLGIPPPLLAATVALQLGAGLSIALGWCGRLGALALGLFCVSTAFLFHTNFASQTELLQFEKDLAIAGGMFVLTATGTGRFSLDRKAGIKTR